MSTDLTPQAVHANPPPRWKFRRLETGDAMRALPEWCSELDSWLPEHDPSWWADAVLHDSGKSILLVSDDQGPFAGLLVHRVGLAFRLGELSLGSIPADRFVLTGGLPEVAASANELAELIRGLLAVLGSKGVVFLQGVHDDEPLRAAIDRPEVRKSYLVLRHGAPYQRCRVRLEGSLDAYLASLGSATRKDLRRTMRSFREKYGGVVEFQVVTTPAEMESVFPELERLSAKTYQARLLKLGVAPGNEVEHLVRSGMRRGICRVDVMRVGGQPISFQIGYFCGDTFCATECGYDPEWTKVQPGIVHLVYLFEELCRMFPAVRNFDFMYGEDLYKRRLSNRFHRESQYYLIPRTARGWSTWIAMQTMDRTSKLIGKVLEKLKLKKSVRNLLRRHA